MSLFYAESLTIGLYSCAMKSTNTAAVLTTLLLSAVQPVQAQTPSSDALEDFVRARVGDNHRVEVRFGQLPKGTRLKPCKQIQPFMPRGVRLWGRTRIGVRCIDGARWSIALPVTVKVFGKALVAARQLPARSALAVTDVELKEVELSRQPGQPLNDLAAIDGQMTTRPIRIGQALMSYHIAFAPTISAGDPVRIRVRGEGFTVMATGAALAAGRDGQPLRVRTDAGKVLLGTLKGRTVEIVL